MGQSPQFSPHRENRLSVLLKSFFINTFSLFFVLRLFGPGRDFFSVNLWPLLPVAFCCPAVRTLNGLQLTVPG
jgi:hypothetical protein